MVAGRHEIAGEGCGGAGPGTESSFLGALTSLGEVVDFRRTLESLGGSLGRGDLKCQDLELLNYNRSIDWGREIVKTFKVTLTLTFKFQSRQLLYLPKKVLLLRPSFHGGEESLRAPRLAAHRHAGASHGVAEHVVDVL